MGAARTPHGAAVSTALSFFLAACASAPKSPPAPQAAATPVLDASYDWHGLLLLPFGSVLKDVPFTLHEVLLFRDPAHAAQGEEAECYAMEQTAPRFLARAPSEYLLCFRHDHLAKVEATVNLPQDQAARIFSDACGLWQRNSDAAQTADSPPGATAAGEAAGARVCDGHDAAVGFSGRLEELADGSRELGGARAERALIMRLDALTQP